MAEQQQFGVTGGVQPVGDGLQGPRQVDEVALQEEEIVPDGPLGPGVAPPVRPGPRRQMDGLHPVVPCGELVEQQPRTVR